MVEFNAIAIASLNGLSFKDIHVVNNLRFSIQGLYDNLLPIGLEIHVCEVRAIVKVNVVLLHKHIVKAHRWQEEKRVANDRSNGWYEYRLNKQLV